MHKSRIQRVNVKDDKKIKFSCPHCHTTNYCKVGNMGRVEGFTLNCAYCHVMLIIERNRVKNFNEVIHKSCSKWPKDGENTYSVEL